MYVLRVNAFTMKSETYWLSVSILRRSRSIIENENNPGNRYRSISVNKSHFMEMKWTVSSDILISSAVILDKY